MLISESEPCIFFIMFESDVGGAGVGVLLPSTWLKMKSDKYTMLHAGDTNQ